jgi:hypothetical protein
MVNVFYCMHDRAGGLTHVCGLASDLLLFLPALRLVYRCSMQ